MKIGYAPSDMAWDMMAARSFAPLGRILIGTGMAPPTAVALIDHTTPPQWVAPDPGVTVAYGKYLASTCSECHGAQLNGMPFGTPGEEVPSPNLTPGGELASRSEEDFLHSLRSGVTPNADVLSIEMPWVYYGQMSDEALKALWMYLQSLPALVQGG